VSKIIRKCPECGFEPEPGVEECPVDFVTIQSFCTECSLWLSDSVCTRCRERGDLEETVARAKAAGDVAPALSAARRLAETFPHRPEYRPLLVALERAAKTWSQCQRIAWTEITTLRALHSARQACDEAGATYRVAGIPERHLEPYRHCLLDAEKRLEGVERLKQQMLGALGPAALVAVVMAITWAAAHLVACAGGHPRTVDADAVASSLVTRSVLSGVSLALLILFIRGPSWEIPGPLLQLATAAAGALLVCLLSLVQSYWVGLTLVVAPTAILAWIIEAGVSSKGPAGNPLRRLIADRWASLRRVAGPRCFAPVGVGAVALSLAAPSLRVPGLEAGVQPFAPVSATLAATPPINPAPNLPAASSTSRGPPSLGWRCEPQYPRAGQEFRIRLTGASLGASPLRFQYRSSGTVDWNDLAGDTLTLSNLSPGALHLEFRALDATGNSSGVLAGVWQVFPSEPLRPDVHIVRWEPLSPISGGTLTVLLASSIPDPSLTFQYRAGVEARWQDAPGGTVRLTDLQAGELKAEFRSTNRANQQSETISHVWDVRSLRDIPLVGRVANWSPEEPLVGADLRIRLQCDRPSPRIVYQYCLSPDDPWADAADGQVTIRPLRLGLLKFRFRVVDYQCRDYTTPIEHTWSVRRQRFEVTRLRLQPAGLIADITDHASRKNFAVGKSDHLADYLVKQISVKERLIVARSLIHETETLRIEIPEKCADAIRTLARQTARQRARTTYWSSPRK